MSRPWRASSWVVLPSVTSKAKSTLAVTPTTSPPGAKVEMLAESSVATTSSGLPSKPAPVTRSRSSAARSATPLVNESSAPTKSSRG